MTSTKSAQPSKVRLGMARQELSLFVIQRAIDCRSVLGFGWKGVPDAPSTYADLKAAFAISQDTRQPLPVSSENLNNTVFLYETADYALRFWHDTSHVLRQRSFRTVDELDLGLWHVAVAKAMGLSAPALKLLDADLIGQQLLYAATKTFPIDQLEFDLDVLTYGVADAIVLERERQQLVAA